MSNPIQELVERIIHQKDEMLQQDYHFRAWLIEEKIKLLPKPTYELVFDDLAFLHEQQNQTEVSS